MKLIGTQPYRSQVWLCGKYDEAHTLCFIAGWAVGSTIAIKHADGIAELKRRGLITIRRHIAPIGEWDSYALTSSGFDRLSEIGYGDLHDRAVRAHHWYAENTSR